MTYVLKRHEDGKYVARSGSEHSYTRKLESAQTYSTRESALANACGNESAVSVDDLMRG